MGNWGNFLMRLILAVIIVLILFAWGIPAIVGLLAAIFPLGSAAGAIVLGLKAIVAIAAIIFVWRGWPPLVP